MISAPADHLRALGLSAYEAQIFAVLLANSPVSATFIAKKCRLSRSSVYTTLSALLAKGLVITTQKNGVKQFMAADLEALGQLLKREQEQLNQKQNLFAKVETQLRALGQPDLHVPQVRFFEGAEGLKQAYLAMMREARRGTTLYLVRDEFVWRPEWAFIFSPDWHGRIKRLKQDKNLQTKLLVNASRQEQEKKEFYAKKPHQETRFLPAATKLQDFALYVLGDTVNLLSFEQGNLLGITLINEGIAQNLQALFGSWWNTSKA